jgi:hypothetical protein
MQSVSQVYGGTNSIYIGSYSWSFIGSGKSTARSGDTYCSGCAVSVSDVAIINSVAVSKTTTVSGKCDTSCSLRSDCRSVFFVAMIVFANCCGYCIDLHNRKRRRLHRSICTSCAARACLYFCF